MKGFITILLTTLVLTWFVAKGKTARPRDVDGVWILAPIQGISLVMLLGFSLGLFLLFLGLRGPVADRNLVVIGGLSFSAFSVIAWPKAIYVHPTGVLQKSWYGGRKFISWESIKTLKEQRDGSILVLGNSAKIVLTKFHMGRELFLRTMAQHGKNIA